ncbi:Enoyl-CoA hydratase [Handroanthus impetiginosus]|uniref:3-hydroxyisobutyryl-CoA hydrolase n=1 Tax=Handroanthus impetiginosus TaxID=429701 RepID=A0A2G9I781_9LAMI|nr:Enoyl-CoA hydratase [Handroanthus impetiginosus]
MAQKGVNPAEEVVLGEEKGRVRVLTLNQPRRLNVISFDVVALLAKLLEKWEKDDEAELILIKGSGRAFSAGGDLKMFYDGRTSKDPSLEVVYRMYWLCYHIHTYKKTEVALVHGISMGGGASLMVPMKFSVVTEKTVFATPEASIGFHTDCSFSYILSHLPGHLGEFLGLTGARLNGAELVATGLATHFVPSEKLPELENRLINLNSGEENAVKAVIEEFAINVQIDEKSVLNKKAIIDECFSKDSVEEILASLEAEAGKEGNNWIVPLLQGLKRSSPTALKITLRTIREGRKQTLVESQKKEFRVTMNILRTVISGDVYEGIRAVTIDKDNAPKWDPPTLEAVDAEKINKVFQPFEELLELKVPTGDDSRWEGKYEDSPYAASSHVSKV